MAQKLWRVVRTCVELGPGNPIQQIHDQGAGGNCNVVRTLWHQLDMPCPGRAQHALALVVQKPLRTLRCLHMRSACCFAALSCMCMTLIAAVVVTLQGTSAHRSIPHP